MKTQRNLFCMALFMLLFNSLTSFAQSPFHIGVKAGANYSSLTTNLKGINTKNAMGYSVGITTQYDFQKFYIQADALYTQHKTTLEQQDFRDQSLKLNTIDIPVVLGYKLLNLSLAEIHIFGGAKYTYALDKNLSFQSNLEGMKSNINQSNLSLKTGVGVSVWKLNVDLAYEYGLKNISKDFKSKPHNFNLSVGYFFL